MLQECSLQVSTIKFIGSTLPSKWHDGAHCSVARKEPKKNMGCCNLQVTAAGSHINTEEMQWRRFVRKPDRKSSANLGIVTQSYPSPTVTSRSEVIIICPNSIVKCHNLRLEGQTSSVFKSTSSLRTILYIPLFPFKKPKLL